MLMNLWIVFKFKDCKLQFYENRRLFSYFIVNPRSPASRWRRQLKLKRININCFKIIIGFLFTLLLFLAQLVEETNYVLSDKGRHFVCLLLHDVPFEMQITTAEFYENRRLFSYFIVNPRSPASRWRRQLKLKRININCFKIIIGFLFTLLLFLAQLVEETNYVLSDKGRHFVCLLLHDVPFEMQITTADQIVFFVCRE